MKVQRASQNVDAILRRTFLCPSCSLVQPSRVQELPRKRQRLDRYASTLSTTAINGSRPIPPRNQPLYDALTDIKTKASSYVNLSRLQLALQGLESETPVTRIALLGLNVQDTARRIARLLLADALEDEQAWEKQIIQHEGSHGILLRYGQPQNSNILHRTTLPVLQIPAPLLEKLNVEILITSINAEQNGTKIPPEAFLAPAVGVPTAFDGRQVTVNQPVHRVLLVAANFAELIRAIETLSLTQFKAEEDKDSVTLVANLAGSRITPDSSVLVSDLSRAEKGISAIRQSVSQATVYEHEWLGSGVPQLSDWFLAESERSDVGSLPVVVERLVKSILTAASTEADQAGLLEEQITQTSTLDPVAKLRIENAIDDFSRAAHQELQSGLASAWSSRNWRKLSWYKLFWRVDDVGLIISDLVTNTWLPKTERATYEISGRLTQSGINPIMPLPEVPATEHKTAFETETTQATILDPAPPLLATATTGPANEIVLPHPTQAVLEKNSNDSTVVTLQPAKSPIPISASISTARASYLKQQITALTSTAQQLVLRTLSISGLSAGLSALTYVSQIAPTMYEAGSIFAVGTVFALYRMQTGWQHATKALETGLFAEGRDVVRRVVQRMRELVEGRAAELSVGNPIERQMLKESKDAIDRAKRAFEQLQGRR